MAAPISLVMLLELFLLFNVISKTFGAEICFLENYDTYNLTQRQWRVQLSNRSCPFPAKQSCVVKFTFCSPLREKKSCVNASVCQLSQEEFFKMATYTLHRPFVALTNNSEGFQSVFDPGSLYNNSGSTCKLKTTLRFTCDEKMPWPLQGPNGDQNVPTTPTITFNKTSCQYNMTFKYAGACVTFIPVTRSTELSAGTVLVIILFVVMFVYFVFGTMWNMGCKGARGLEAVPNYDFWTDLPVLVADGFLFTFRCGRLDSTGTTYESI
ncbi:uncharacterized protein LOC121383826 [Gigantopelta aegis]|uniref:uncharacterized protein LOC121383826 n=1 Tax=Gigantopelta aegis TaxID=1735272 RepID=UPI001B888D51|nr:uncharacterized protein LOC121383826 [Gigantopelta aegis]